MKIPQNLGIAHCFLPFFLCLTTTSTKTINDHGFVDLDLIPPPTAAAAAAGAAAS